MKGRHSWWACVLVLCVLLAWLRVLAMLLVLVLVLVPLAW